MEMSDPHRSLSRREEKSLLRIAAASARSEFGIPERTGCPNSEMLKSLAHRQPSPPETPDLIDHIGTCSPCFIEYSRYRTNHKHRVRILYTLACAAAVLVCFAAVRSLHTPTGRPLPPPGREIAGSQELVLDLRLNGVSRSDTPDKRQTRRWDHSSSSAHQTISLDPTADRQRGWDLRRCTYQPRREINAGNERGGEAPQFCGGLASRCKSCRSCTRDVPVATSPLTDTMDFIFNLARVTGGNSATPQRPISHQPRRYLFESREQPVYASRRFSKLRREFRSLGR